MSNFRNKPLEERRKEKDDEEDKKVEEIQEVEVPKEK